MHPDKQTASVAVAAFPRLNVSINLFPTPKVEVANAKISMSRVLYRFDKDRQESTVDVVKNPWQPAPLWSCSLVQPVLKTVPAVKSL